MAGRKLSFDPDVALEQMMRVFWAQGFAATSVDDLCRAVGVPKPSLYSYFGDKEEILVQALRLFGENAPQRCESFRESRGGLAERLTSLMTTTRFEGQCGGATPAGCLLTNTVAEFAGASSRVDEVLADMNRLNEKGLVAFFEDARERGELRRSAEPRALAAQVNTFVKGLAISRKAGVSTRALREQVEFFVEILVGAVGK